MPLPTRRARLPALALETQIWYPEPQGIPGLVSVPFAVETVRLVMMVPQVVRMRTAMSVGSACAPLETFTFSDGSSRVAFAVEPPTIVTAGGAGVVGCAAVQLSAYSE